MPEFFQVKNIYITCSYIGAQGLYANDIAILELKNRFKLTATLMPVCLDPNAINEDLKPGAMGKVAGFGKTESGQTSYLLRTITVPFVSLEECKNTAAVTNSKPFITADKFCAGYTNGRKM